MHQLVQLEEWRERFETLGVRVAGMTYDSQDILAGFHAERDLQYPLLRDIDAKHVNALGIRNSEYEPGHSAYGVPYPGILYVAADGTIQGKFAVPGYRNRPPFEQVLSLVQAKLGQGG